MGKRDLRTVNFRRMVTIGPSITAGGWATCRERCWSSVLAGLISDFQSEPVELFNMGLGANVLSGRGKAYEYATKPSGTQRLERDVITPNPDLVIIGEFMINDARGGTTPDIYREDLEESIDRIRRKLEPVIVLLGLSHIVDWELGAPTWGHSNPEKMAEFDRLTREVAENKDCLYVDVPAAMGETDWMVHYDGVHLSDLGHRIIAHRIFEKLAQNCSCLAASTQDAEKTSPAWRDETHLAVEC